MAILNSLSCTSEMHKNEIKDNRQNTTVPISDSEHIVVFISIVKSYKSFFYIVAWELSGFFPSFIFFFF